MAFVSLCLIVTSVFLFGTCLGQTSPTLGQTSPTLYDGIDKCRWEFEYIKCPDYSQIVSCFEKLGNVTFTNSLQETLKDLIDLYRIKRDVCPGFTDQGKCVHLEVGNCVDNLYIEGGHYAKSCKGLETAVQCLQGIMTACNDSYAREQEDWIKDVKAEYCDLSIAYRKCIDDVDACSLMVTYPSLGENGDSSSCSLTDSARECLDKVESDSVCNKTDSMRTKIQNQREYLQDVDKVCQVASGPCSKKVMDACTDIVYGLDTFSCPPSKLEDATTCLDDVETACTMDHQKDVLQSERASVARYCSMAATGSGNNYHHQLA